MTMNPLIHESLFTALQTIPRTAVIASTGLKTMATQAWSTCSGTGMVTIVSPRLRHRSIQRDMAILGYLGLLRIVTPQYLFNHDVPPTSRIMVEIFQDHTHVRAFLIRCVAYHSHITVRICLVNGLQSMIDWLRSYDFVLISATPTPDFMDVMLVTI